MRKNLAALFLAVASMTTVANADTVTFKNGDKLTGKIGLVAGGKLTIVSPSTGEITVDLANVESYVTDAPATIKLKEGAPVTDKVTAGDAATIKLADGKTVNVSDIKAVNPPAEAWTGVVVVNGALARGNTDTFTLGATAAAELRRDNQFDNDRFGVGAAYNFGTTGKADNTVTTTDNWNVNGKYDRFWTEKWYGYINGKIEHDRIAFLNYRLTPGVGIGYQWLETPKENFRTEAGFTFVYSDYEPGDTDENLAVRLAYHYDNQFRDNLAFFSNGEYLPAIDDPGDYNLNADAGVRVDLTEKFFAQFKVEYKRDSTPAPEALKNDFLYTVGLGWKF